MATMIRTGYISLPGSSVYNNQDARERRLLLLENKITQLVEHTVKSLTQLVTEMEAFKLEFLQPPSTIHPEVSRSKVPQFSSSTSTSVNPPPGTTPTLINEPITILSDIPDNSEEQLELGDVKLNPVVEIITPNYREDDPLDETSGEMEEDELIMYESVSTAVTSNEGSTSSTSEAQPQPQFVSFEVNSPPSTDDTAASSPKWFRQRPYSAPKVTCRRDTSITDMFVCTCGNQYSQMRSLWRHVNQGQTKPAKCKFCNQTGRADNIMAHIRRCHPTRYNNDKDLQKNSPS